MTECFDCQGHNTTPKVATQKIMVYDNNLTFYACDKHASTLIKFLKNHRNRYKRIHLKKAKEVVVFT